jgi:hypothetical protein
MKIKINQSNCSHWLYLIVVTCFDPQLGLSSSCLVKWIHIRMLTAVSSFGQCESYFRELPVLHISGSSAVSSPFFLWVLGGSSTMSGQFFFKSRQKTRLLSSTMACLRVLLISPSLRSYSCCVRPRTLIPLLQVDCDRCHFSNFVSLGVPSSFPWILLYHGRSLVPNSVLRWSDSLQFHFF